MGSRFCLVAVHSSCCGPSRLDDQLVRKLTGFTKDLRLPAEWLVLIRIATVAMESTGCYWAPPYEMLVDKCMGR